MKITKRGVDPKKKVHCITCKNCSTEYEYTIADPEILTAQGYGRETDSSYFICSVCSEKVFITTK